ncbi:MAG: ATP-grasp domain-containing protein [Nitrospirae bacterium YQR-1]
MIRALVLDGCINSALAVTRSLSMHGVSVTCGAESVLCKTLYSKHTSRKLVYTSPERCLSGFIRDIKKELISLHYDAVFAVSDKTVLALSLKRNELEQMAGLAIAPHEPYMKALNKVDTITAAQTLAIPVPKTFFPETIQDLKLIENEIFYPLVIKPRQSEYPAGDRIVSGGAPTYAANSVQLHETFRNYNSQLPLPMVQEYIPGQGRGVFALFNKDGKCAAYFAHKRLRDIRPTGGGSSYRESAELDETLKYYTEKLLNHIHWEGVAMVEFREDKRDGSFKLMEINGRLWNSLALAVASGVDFPYLLFKLCSGDDVPPVYTYQKGLKCRWIMGDIRHIIEVFRGRPQGYTGDFPKLLPAIGNVVFDFFREKSYYDVLSMSDPGPFAAECIAFIATPIRKKITRLLQGKCIDGNF